MRSTKLRALPLVVSALVAGALLTVPAPAQAAVTTTTITSPLDGTHFLIDDNNIDDIPTVTVTGTSNGTTGDIVDIRCYTVGASDWLNGPFNVPVQADGTFSVQMPISDPYGACRLRAVPDNLPKGDSIAGFSGPTVTTEYFYTQQVEGGSNDGKTFDYYVAYQGAKALNDYSSVTNAGLWDTRLNYPDGSASNYLWDAAASLRVGLDGRSAIKVDGRDAYGPYSAENAIAGDIPGAPSMTVSATRNGVTGVTTVKETNPLVYCPGNTTFPPTAGTCPQFKSAGVRLERTIVTTDSGLQVHITDVWRSTDGKAHTIGARYQERVHGFDYLNSADTPVAFRLPWIGGFQTFSGDTTYPGPAKLANSILVRDSNVAPDGDQLLPRGALTFDFPVGVRRTAYDRLELQAATFTVAAGKSRTLRQSLVAGTTEASVAAKAAANATRLNPYRVDGLLRRAGGATVGNGKYNTTGIGQTVVARTKRSRTATFVITLQNDGTQPTGFRLKGPGARPGFVVKYLKGARGTTAVTTPIVRGNYVVSGLQPGASHTIRLVVTVKAGTRIDALGSWLVLATSTKDATRKDAVRARVRVVR